MDSFKIIDPLGIQRVVQPKGVLPQQAEILSTNLPIAEDELLVEVESLNVDSASFHQISESAGGDVIKIQNIILELVEKRGKLHNPVTGSGGMFIGTVAQIGPKFPVQDKPVKVGDRIASLVSLSLTPLNIKKIKQIHQTTDRVDIEGYAVLFASGIFSKLPDDLPETVALAVLDVAGAPAQTQRLVKAGNVVVVIGGGGKSGILSLYEAKKTPGAKTIAVDYDKESIHRLSELSFVDEVIHADARNAVALMDKIWDLTKGKMADVVINVANIPDTEMATILSCRVGGIAYFFSMTTSFQKAALGAEGMGIDVDLRIGNGYCPSHAEIALNILRESPEINRIFMETYS
ncbi:MAG: L-erythro-3,5-diaminohexanoate dehydrogenase [Bdellovibrio sp.]|nr:L-erythro-3,5-diaminohexanoate dehydrogenase [Bdellovibrio sp.]